jgi:hypothetical protein
MKCRNLQRQLFGSSRGVALVLTLIMLAIITVVTVVFLATARRQRQTTTVRLDQTAAEYAAEVGYQRAVSEVMTNMLGAMVNTGNAPNLLSFDFRVSRRGPSVPWVNVTNASGSIGNYLDLNRDGQFNDPNDPTNYPYGDPEWIAVNDKSWYGGAPNNRALVRTAYIVLPAGKSLDINTIHNAAHKPNPPAPAFPNGQFIRNQGFGPWELNLAAFLAELNTNVWFKRPNGSQQYSYGPFPNPTPAGDAFLDADSIVEFRRNWDPNSRPKVPLAAMFPNAVPPLPAAVVFPTASIDAYGDGNNGTVLGVNPFVPDDDRGNRAKLTSDHWFGSDPTNHWFHPQEFFDNISYKVTNNFYQNLYYAITGSPPDNIAGDPISYYRMLAQLSTDTSSDFHDRINLNYAAVGTNSASDFVPWNATPELAVTFFTNVAERIFLAQSNEFNPFPGTNAMPIRSINEIPIWPTNRYSTAIHRILQEAANIFDATHTNIYPAVFRPVFGSGPVPGGNYIVGYIYDDRVSTLQAWLDTNTNGIPLVIGAKKWLPNFNEFSIKSDITIARKLEVVRDSPPAFQVFPIGTNQMYLLGISNYFGLEAWNSYGRRYPRPITITVSNYAAMWLSNDLGFQTNQVLTSAKSFSVPSWAAAPQRSLMVQPTNSFIIALDTNQVFLSNAVYRFGPNRFESIGENAFEDDPTFKLPYWVYAISNRVSYLASDGDRIVDFVLLNDNHVVDVHRDLLGASDPYFNLGAGNLTGVWETNRNAPNAPTYGVIRQAQISLGSINSSASDWRAFTPATSIQENDKQAAIEAFRSFVGLNQVMTNVDLTKRRMESPFNPAAKISVVSTWQANDPLVHYHVQDLRMGMATNSQYLKPSQASTNLSPSSLGRWNDVYSPWGGRPNSSVGAASDYDRMVKDAGVYSSDYWDFPTNKLATIGLLGRVHRGTPWQSIYLKAEAAPATGANGWTNLSADIAVHENGLLFSRSHPTNDWRLMDMFTTAIDEQMSRGLMSVNQTNVASWSALLSGIVVLSNSLATAVIEDPRQYTEMFIEPWGQRPIAQSQLAQIWTNIYGLQLSHGRPIERSGDLLQAPALTVASPFLNTSDPEQVKWGIDDFAYEQIPQQILSLLRVGQPRFIVYAYGQALKPVEINPANGEVINYQVTAEYATRTVVRIEGDPRTRVRAVVESFNVLPPD